MIEEDEMYYDTEEDMFAEDVKIEDGPKLQLCMHESMLEGSVTVLQLCNNSYNITTLYA